MNCPNCNEDLGFITFLKNTQNIICKNCDSKFVINGKGFHFWFPMIIAGLSGFISSALSRYFFPEQFSFSYFIVFFIIFFMTTTAGYWIQWRFGKFEFKKR